MKKMIKIFTPLAIGTIVGLITSKGIKDYNMLISPPLAPPKILFPIAWTILYTTIGYSYYLYSKKDNKYKKLYITNLIMNYLWPILFFSLKQRILGSILIVALLIETIIYMKNIKKVDNTSFYLLIPYLAWLTFATYLSIGTTLLNM